MYMTESLTACHGLSEFVSMVKIMNDEFPLLVRSPNERVTVEVREIECPL